MSLLGGLELGGLLGFARASDSPGTLGQLGIGGRGIGNLTMQLAPGNGAAHL